MMRAYDAKMLEGKLLTRLNSNPRTKVNPWVDIILSVGYHSRGQGMASRCVVDQYTLIPHHCGVERLHTQSLREIMNNTGEYRAAQMAKSGNPSSNTAMHDDHSFAFAQTYKGIVPDDVHGARYVRRYYRDLIRSRHVNSAR